MNNGHFVDKFVLAIVFIQTFIMSYVSFYVVMRLQISPADLLIQLRDTERRLVEKIESSTAERVYKPQLDSLIRLNDLEPPKDYVLPSVD